MTGFLDFFTKYWVQWIFGLIAAGIVAWTRHIIKLEKTSVAHTKAERMKEIRSEIVEELEEKIDEVRQRSDKADEQMQLEINEIKTGINHLNSGILSIQSKQFREECIRLLNPDHFITFDEYQQFEEDYSAYKELGGNHNGDALHNRVVEKFTAQVTTTPGK